MIGFITKTSADFSREVILTWALVGYLLMAASYLLIQNFYRRHIRRIQKHIRSLVIGGSEHAKLLAEKLVRIRNEPLQGSGDLAPIGAPLPAQKQKHSTWSGLLQKPAAKPVHSAQTLPGALLKSHKKREPKLPFLCHPAV